MARPEPRRPDWLALTPPAAAGHTVLAPQAAQQRDETVRALVFPATASRPATAAATARRPAGAPPTLLKPAAGAAVPPGSALAAEPAYRSALDRLLQRPGTAPGTASAARGGSAAAPAAAAGSAAPTLPSSRLDSLLVAGRPASTQQAQQAQQPQHVERPSLDSLLRRPPVASASARRAPLPSSRLDELLARPATAAGSSSWRPAAPAAAGQSAAAARPAALSPVDEEPSPFGRLQAAVGGGSAGPVGPRPAGGDGISRPATAATHAAPSPKARPSAAGAPGLAPEAPVARAAAAAAVAALDPGLHDRLRQRIEEAKAQMRQQLSPMFRLSDALLGTGQDAGKAAQALDAATGLAASGFEQLAARPGSRGGGSAAASSKPAAVGPAQQQLASPAQLEMPLPTQQQQQQHQQRGNTQQHGQQPSEEQQAPVAWEDGGAPDLHPAFAAGASSADEVDSLVANARAAAARAQSAIAGLTSPPRLHTAAAGGAPGSTTPSGSSAPRSSAPLPHAQQQRGQPPTAELQLAAHGGVGSGQLAMPAGDAAVMVGRLREQSEALIRSECERLVAGMHAVLDTLLDSLQQGQQAQHGQQAQQGQQGQQAQVDSAQQGQQAQEAQQQQQEWQLPSSPGHPAGSSGSRGSLEAADASAAASSHGSEGEGGAEPQGQQTWLPPPPPPSQQQEADQQWQQLFDATADDGCSAGEPFAFAAPVQQWAPQQEEQQQSDGAGATPSGGSPPELPDLGGLSGAGFGSPFKLPSQHPSPAKHRGNGGPRAQADATWAAHQAQQHEERQTGATAKSLTFAPLPAAAAGAAVDQVTPALLRPSGGGLDAYRTARSTGSAASSAGGGSGSRMASSGGGNVGGAAATPGYYSTFSRGFSSRTPAGSAARGLATPLLGSGAAGGGKDMDQLLGSIRQLAAEMRVKQGTGAAPTSPLPRPGVQAAVALGAGLPAAASAAKPPR